MSLGKHVTRMAELCLYWAIPGFFLRRFGTQLVCAPIFFLIAAAVFLCCLLHTKALPLRLLPLLVFPSLLCWDPSVSSLLFLLPPCLLTLMRALSDSWDIDSDLMRRLLLGSPLVYLVFIGLYAISDMYTPLIELSLPWFMAWLLLAVFGLRLVRSDTGKSRTLAMLNGLLLLSLALLCFLLSRPALTHLLGKGISLLYMYVISPLLLGLLILVCLIPAGIVYGIVWLVRYSASGSVQEVQLSMGADMQELLGETDVIPKSTPEWLHLILPVLGTALFVLLTILLVRRFASRGSSNWKSSGGVRREKLTTSDRPRSVPFKANRSTSGIRASYRKYLKLCQSLGMDISGAYASDRVLEISASQLDYSKADRLRQLWLPVRYSNGGCSPEGTREAAALVKELSRKKPGK